MKHIKVIIACILVHAGNLFSQVAQPPTGLGMSGTGATSGTYWARGGNNNSFTPNNVFGTLWNSPIYTVTSGTNRMRVNGVLTTPVNMVSHNVSGFVGIAPSGYFSANTPITMLHLYGPNNEPGFGIGGGFRSWMHSGMFVNENSDALYIGMKPETGTNRSDAILCWNDDAGAGQDKLRFVFTGAFNNANGNGSNPIDPRSLNGYEYMRMSSSPTQTNTTGQPTGNVGIGPVFTDVLPPQNRLHMNSEEYWSNWFQMSIAQSTGQTNTDGLKLGILGDLAPATNIRNGNAFLYNQEDRHLIFSTNHATPTSTSATNERMRITSFNAPTNTPTGYGVYIPAGSSTPSDATRVSISYDPANPVTRPLSLLHLGYNAGLFSFTPGATDGWRPWMDIGTFISNGTDNGYVGLKAETGGFPPGDRQDMVINWGDNQATPLGTGPDNLRFIFTSTTTGTEGTAPATGPDGLEGLRMTPTAGTGVFTGIGGDPTALPTGNPYFGGGINPTATLEVNSWGATTVAGGSSGLRFTNMQAIVTPTTFNPGNGVLSVNEFGDVIYVPAGGNAPGNYCFATTTSPLTANYEMPLNNHNYYFSDAGSSAAFNNVGIGVNCAALTAKLMVVNRVMDFGIDATTSKTTANNYGVRGTALNATGESSGIYGQAVNSGPTFNTGVYGQASSSIQTNYGGKFRAFSASTGNIGVDARGNGATGSNIGVNANAQSGSVAYGIKTSASATAGNTSYGIYASEVVTDAFSRAGYFLGDVEIASGTLISDQMFKTNVSDIKSGRDLLKKLKPHTYKMDQAGFPQFGFDDHLQYGFIAQEVAPVLPELVYDSRNQGETDSAGNVIIPPLDYKALNYNALIPIAVQAINELGAQVDKSTLSDQAIKTNVQNLSGSLAKVKQMRGVKYQWSAAAQSSMDLDSLQHIGFIAQEINAIEPLLTYVDDSSLMHVNYDRVVPLLVESIKDLDAQLQQKDSALAAMQQQISQILTNMESCCNSNHSMQSTTNNAIGTDVDLKDSQSIVLEQNVPNPFAEQTTISYFLPDHVSKAQILFYNAQGKLIQSTELTQKGKGSLNVFASDLSNGIYTYTLVVDGKIVETKKMMKQ